MGVLSGLEMACWDIVGKAVGKPVYELLGGRVHDRLRIYTYLYPEDGRPGRRLPRPGPGGGARTPYYADRASPHSSSTRSAPYSTFDPRQP